MSEFTETLQIAQDTPNTTNIVPLVDVEESYRTSEQNSYTSVDVEPVCQIKQTRHRLTREEAIAIGRQGNVARWKQKFIPNEMIRTDQAFKTYDEYREHTPKGLMYASNAAREFLTTLRIPITNTALSELIQRTREQHRADNFTTDLELRRFAKHPKTTYRHYAGLIKGIFKANNCPLAVSIRQPQAKKDKRINAGILKAIYDSLPRDELRLIADLCAFVPERVAAICEKTPMSDWEDYDEKYTIIRFDPAKTKVHYEHIGIIPRVLANRIRAYAKAAGRYPGAPFPNHETLWMEITKFATAKFGIHLTSKYCRKEYVAKAKKTPMPANDWDFLAGHKQKVGNQAHHYDPEDDDELVREYDKFLAPYLGLGNTAQPDDAPPVHASENIGTLTTPNNQIQMLLEENRELKTQILQLTKLLTQYMAKAS